MSYIQKREPRAVYFTASPVNAKGKSRNIVIASHPEFAIVRLNGLKEEYPLSWKKIYEVALQLHKMNPRVEAQGTIGAPGARRRRNRKKVEGFFT